MPGYGIEPAEAGSGLLPWSWAVERLAASHDYWLATVTPDGRPHVMPGWGVWEADALWFSSSKASRKARNVASNAAWVLTTDNPRDPVVLEGRAELVTNLETIGVFVGWTTAKYGTDYALDFFDPAVNACYRVRPTWVLRIDGGRLYRLAYTVGLHARSPDPLMMPSAGGQRRRLVYSHRIVPLGGVA